MKPVEILSSHNLKRTSCREGIINVMMSSQIALSENEIRDRLVGNYDRTTFYRSFKTLEENRIIHKIVVDNQLIKYAIDNLVSHKKEHAHFYCNICKTVRCLDSIEIEKPTLPPGFVGSEVEVVIKGTCSICQNNNSGN